MKKLALAIIVLSSLGFSLKSEAAQPESYSVEQESITIKRDSHGLDKALCYFSDKNGKHITNKIVTITAQYDNLYIIETLMDRVQHVRVVTVECK